MLFNLPEDKYDTVVDIIVYLSDNNDFDNKKVDEIADKTLLSEKRRHFLQSIGKIKVDEETINKLRQESMI